MFSTTPARARMESMGDESRRVGYARTSRRRHPARFVWQMAVAISCGAGRILQLRLEVLHIPALQPLGDDNRSWWIKLPSNTVSGFTMVPLGYIFHGGSQLFSCNIFHMASFSIVESLDLGKALVDEKKALVTYKR